MQSITVYSRRLRFSVRSVCGVNPLCVWQQTGSRSVNSRVVNSKRLTPSTRSLSGVNLRSVRRQASYGTAFRLKPKGLLSLEPGILANSQTPVNCGYYIRVIPRRMSLPRAIAAELRVGTPVWISRTYTEQRPGSEIIAGQPSINDACIQTGRTIGHPRHRSNRSRTHPDASAIRRLHRPR